MAKTTNGTMSIGTAPTQMAMPSVKITNPKYIGLRVKRYGPAATSLRLLGEVGLTSVPSRRKRKIAHTGKINPAMTTAIPSATSGRPGTLGQPSHELIPVAIKT